MLYKYSFSSKFFSNSFLMVIFDIMIIFEVLHKLNRRGSVWSRRFPNIRLTNPLRNRKARHSFLRFIFHLSLKKNICWLYQVSDRKYFDRERFYYTYTKYHKILKNNLFDYENENYLINSERKLIISCLLISILTWFEWTGFVNTQILTLVIEQFSQVRIECL